MCEKVESTYSVLRRTSQSVFESLLQVCRKSRFENIFVFEFLLGLSNNGVNHEKSMELMSRFALKQLLLESNDLEN